MINFDKFANSKISIYSDWIIKLVLINVLIILTSLPVITIFPAFIAGYGLLKKYYEGENEPVIKGYYKLFMQNFKKSFLIEIILVIFLSILTYNIFYFIGTMDQLFINKIGLYVMLVFAVFFIFTVLHLGNVIINYEDLSIKVTIKLAFIFSFKFIITTCLIVLAWVPTILMIIFIPPLVSFIAFSLPLLLSYIVSKPIYSYIARITEEGEPSES